MSNPSLATSPSYQPAWSVQLSTQYFVNSVAICDDGTRVVAGTFYHNYTLINPTGVFGIYCYDNTGKQLWNDSETMFEGVYWVAISGNGQVAAASGWFASGQGLLRAYDATTGTQLLNYTAIPNRVSAVSLSTDGSLLAAIAGNTIYVFMRQGNGAFSPTPVNITLANAPEAVAVHPSGQWLVACDNTGTVYLVPTPNGQVGLTYQWQPANAQVLHSVAISSQSTYFVAGGDDGNVYLFEMNAMIQQPGPVAQLSVGQRIRWVAASGNAGLITAVTNNGTAGTIFGVSFNGQVLTNIWGAALQHNPNSTSMDSQGVYVTACDGYQGPGAFYMFNGNNGNLMWSYPTTQMNWPMFVNTDGSAIAAGSDAGSVYYFNT